MITQEQYEEYKDQEAHHWGFVSPDPHNPQIWHDEKLFDIFFRNHYEQLLGRASSAGSPVLELGCGEGHLAIALAQRGCSVEGIDLSPERILRARQNSAKQSLNAQIRFTVGDLNVMTLPENTYRCVVAHDCLHHIVHLDHLMTEVSKSLTQDGILCVMDFAGMSRTRRLLAAGMVAVLPTIRPYSEKWKLRKQLRRFLASERDKREALRTGDSSFLHPESPFEEISQMSMIPTISKHFQVLHCQRFLPFWYYLAPKLRLPSRIRYQTARLLKSLDDVLATLGVEGAYFSLEAKNRESAPV